MPAEDDEPGKEPTGNSISSRPPSATEMVMVIESDDEWAFSLPDEERKWMEKRTMSPSSISRLQLTCTSCSNPMIHFAGSDPDVRRHPVLGVPICVECSSFYFNGEWNCDANGAYKRCGWCAKDIGVPSGSGHCEVDGQSLLRRCAGTECLNVFCSDCIFRNLGGKVARQIAAKESFGEWFCFQCQPKQIQQQRLLYYSLYKAWNKRKGEEKQSDNNIKIPVAVEGVDNREIGTVAEEVCASIVQGAKNVIREAEKALVSWKKSRKTFGDLEFSQCLLSLIMATTADLTDAGKRLLVRSKFKAKPLESASINGTSQFTSAISEENIDPKTVDDKTAASLEELESSPALPQLSEDEEQSGEMSGLKSQASLTRKRQAENLCLGKSVNGDDKGLKRVKSARAQVNGSDDDFMPSTPAKPSRTRNAERKRKTDSAINRTGEKTKSCASGDRTVIHENVDDSILNESELLQERVKLDVLMSSSDESSGDLSVGEKGDTRAKSIEGFNQVDRPSLSKKSSVFETDMEAEHEEAKRSVLNSSESGEDGDAEGQGVKGKKSSNSHSKLEHQPVDDDSSTDVERPKSSTDYASIKVKLKRLPANVLEKVEALGSVCVRDNEDLASSSARGTASSKISDEDSEIDEVDRLCNLRSFEKSKKRHINADRKVPDAKCKGSSSKAKNSKDELVEETLDDEDDEEISSEKNSSLDFGPLTISKAIDVNDLAKAAVLASSSEDEDRKDELIDGGGKGQESKSKKTKRDEQDARKTSGKSSSDKPSFMRVRLADSCSDSDFEPLSGKKASTKKGMKGKKAKVIKSSDEGSNWSGDEGSSREMAEEKDSDYEEDEFTDNDDCDGDDGEITKGSKAKPKLKKAGAKSKAKRKAKKASSSSGELSDDEPKSKGKRRRIQKASSSEDEAKSESPSKGRKDIRKIMSDKKVSEGTREAAIEERERRKRMEEKQKTYNETFEVEKGAKIIELPLDFENDTKKALVEVDRNLCKNLKPHQAKGIKFMWDAVFESKKDVEEGKVPGGAILAHCMGLGKTLQTISLIHAVMKAFPEELRCVLVLCPVNTIKNWADEFEKWLSGPIEEDIEVYEMSCEKDSWGRADRLEMWKREGGVMIMGYDMFRNLSNESAKKFKKKQRDTFQNCLVDPGPDMVICDEGHILKNTKSALNSCMTRITTRRRIILTGTPLQNNLTEYFAMVDFVKPKLLGTYNEFKNRFVNPIQNGQHSDSTDRDVRIMKKRSYILADLLKGCMQRLDYNVLVPYLQPKHEYVLCICLTDFQKKLYKFYLENYARAGQIGSEGKMEGGKKGGLFYDAQNLSRVWNHPYILLMAKNRSDLKKMFEDDDEDEAGSLKDFIDDRSEENETVTSEGSSDEGSNESGDDAPAAPKSRTTRSVASKDVMGISGGLEEAKSEALAASKGWWVQFLDKESDLDEEEQLGKLELGSKMILLMDILKECEMLGDKILVFSQSLLSLDLIEGFLSKAHQNRESKSDNENYLGSWEIGKDYFRMDGSTGPDVRKRWCNYFNEDSNHRMRLFLISTKAGGLGINLCAANRVIIFDASWNPAHDVQSIFRVYRFGQKKPVYIYRFLAKGTMEEKIYDRQVTKQSLSARVVDEQQIERHFSMNELTELYEFNDEPQTERPIPKVPKDLLMAEMLKKFPYLIWKFHDHDSLLENQVDENLTEEERKAAWEEYENEKKGVVHNYANAGMLNENLILSSINPAVIQELYRKQYPHLTEDQVNQATRAYIMQAQSGLTRRPAYDKSHYQQEMARARQQQQMMYPGLYQKSGGAPSSSVASSRVELEKEYARARQIQEQYTMAHQQIQRQIMHGSGHSVSVAGGFYHPAASTSKQPQMSQRNQSQQLITLSSDEETDGTEVPVNARPQIQVHSRPATTSTNRRGRPRLDPSTDRVL